MGLPQLSLLSSRHTLGLVVLLVFASSLSGCAAAGSKMVKGVCLKVPVYYCTTRQDLGTPYSTFRYSTMRDEKQVLHKGTCDVVVPVGLRNWTGDDETWTTTLQRIVLEQPVESITLSAELPNAEHPCFPEYASSQNDRAKDIVVFVHGYNNSFQDAIERSGVLGSEVLTGQRMICFDWASKCRLEGYVCDESTVEATERTLADFLLAMETRANAVGGRVHIIAHSMGARLTCRALQRLALLGGHSFGNVILAAPDVDEEHFAASIVPDLFGEIGSNLTRRPVVESINVYKSPGDVALLSSHAVNGYQRLGYAKKLHDHTKSVAHVDVIIVNGDDHWLQRAQVDPLGHAFFVTSRETMRDMRLALLGVHAKEGDRKALLLQPLAEGVWQLKPHAPKQSVEGP